MVFEGKRQDGELKVYTYEFVNPSFKWIAINWLRQKYAFVIPEGSIKMNFELQ
jgi:hypothetical protein